MILKPKKKLVKDPVRYPKVIKIYEGESKKDFNKSLSLEIEMLKKEMYGIT